MHDKTLTAYLRDEHDGSTGRDAAEVAGRGRQGDSTVRGHSVRAVAGGDDRDGGGRRVEIQPVARAPAQRSEQGALVEPTGEVGASDPEQDRPTSSRSTTSTSTQPTGAFERLAPAAGLCASTSVLVGDHASC